MYSSSAASALRWASSAFAMLPSMAAERSSSSAFIFGRATFQKTNRMMTKQSADQMMSYHAGMSGFCAAPSSAAYATRLCILSP